MIAEAGERVGVGPATGEVVYVQQIGCCGNVSIAVRLDGTGTLIYVKPSDLRPVTEDGR